MSHRSPIFGLKVLVKINFLAFHPCRVTTSYDNIIHTDNKKIYF